MLLALLSFLGGLVLLLLGARWLVDGAGRLGERMGLPPAIVGMVIVGFGTSLPELFVSVSAALQGSAAIAVTNVVGSNIANVGLLLGIAALVTPLTVASELVTREIPMLILGSAAFLALVLDEALGVGPNGLARSDGIALLLFFAIFVYYTVRGALRPRDPFVAEARAAAPAISTSSTTRDALGTVLGLAGVGGGAHLLVSGAVWIAAGLGVPEAVVGLTAVSLGTGLPELASTVMAARSGRHDMAVGNIVGSNIFNTLLVAGTAVTLSPAPLHAGGTLDVLAMLLFPLVLLPMALTHRRRLTRPEGGVLVAAYALYLALVTSRAL